MRDNEIIVKSTKSTFLSSSLVLICETAVTLNDHVSMLTARGDAGALRSGQRVVFCLSRSTMSQEHLENTFI